MFRIVKKAVGMPATKASAPTPSMHISTPPPPQSASLPTTPPQEAPKEFPESRPVSLAIPAHLMDAINLASPIDGTQQTQNRASIISAIEDNHASFTSPTEYHADHGDQGPSDDYPLYDSPDSFNTLDERGLRQMQAEEEAAVAESQSRDLGELQPVAPIPASILSPVVEEDAGSNASSPLIRPLTPLSGNGPLRSEAHAVLRGSPKTLGWQVDEESEEKAWEVIMHDAVSSSVFDEETDDSSESHFIPPFLSQTKEELYRTWLKHWDDMNTELVWRVVPSLKGIHQWILQPKILGEGSVLQCGVEMGTDTDDLPSHVHANAEVQTDIKTYAEVEVQTYEVEVPAGALMLLPEKPLSGTSNDFDLSQTVPSPPRPATPADAISVASRSRSRSPLRRMIPIPSRKPSMASISTQVEQPEPKPAKRSQSPVGSALRRFGSVKSLKKMASPSRRSSIDKGIANASAATLPVSEASAAAPTESARAQSTPTGRPPVTQKTPEETPETAKRPELQQAESQPAPGRWGNAFRRVNVGMGWR